MRPGQSLAFAAGDFYIQDAGSLLALRLALESEAFQSRTTFICDLCAAPGGKATGILETLQPGSFLLANETITSRVGVLLQNLQRIGSDRFGVSSLDPEELAQQLPGTFDVVLVDAPCSGQTLLGKGKSRNPYDAKLVALNVQRQRRILRAAERLLKPGGILVYSTCTFSPDENEAQVDWAVQELQMEPDPSESLAAYESDVTHRRSVPTACYRVWPHEHDCAGAFATRLRKRGFLESSEAIHLLDQANRFEIPCQQMLESCYQFHDGDRYVIRDWVVDSYPQDAPEWLERVADRGPEVAHKTGKTWKPSYAGAIRRPGEFGAMTHPTSTLVLSETTASDYVSGLDVMCDQAGWHAVTHGERPLGWAKASVSRGDKGFVGKNHLPSSARRTIRP